MSDRTSAAARLLAMLLAAGYAGTASAQTKPATTAEALNRM